MSTSQKRTVAGVIDAVAVYGATVAAAGGFAFLSGTAVGETGLLDASAVPPEPYRRSPAAQAQAQAQSIFGRLDRLLPEVGSGVGEIVQIEQYMQLKVHADPYFKIATSKAYLGTAVPVAATAQVGEHVPDGSVVAVTGMAIVPDVRSGFVKSSPDEAGSASTANRKFSEIVVAGPYAFTTLFPSDRKTGLPEAARTPEWIWSGSEIGAEMKWGIAELGSRLETIGATFDDVVDYTLFLTDTADLFEFDEALRAVVGLDAPARTVIPTRGYALPRREGAFGHGDGAPRMEVQLRIRRPESGVDRHVVDGPGSDLGYQSAGVRVGELLWLSSQVADAEHRAGDISAEIEDVLTKLATTCANAGTDLQSALRIRVLLTDGAHAMAFADALRKAIPKDPPAVTVLVVASALAVTDARVAIDAVVHVVAG